MSKYFNEYLKVSPFSHALWRAGEAAVISKVKIDAPLLDLGCGFGEFGKIFYETQVKTGLDISRNDLNIASKRGVYEETILADAVKLPFEDSSFNSCLSLSTLEHIKDPERALNEVYRVLNNHGTFILSVPTEELNGHLIGISYLDLPGLRLIKNIYISLYHKVFIHKTIVPTNTWVGWLKHSGFKDIKIAGTMSPIQLKVYEIFLITGSISQILRKLTGNRCILNFGLRTLIFNTLYRILTKKYSDDTCTINIVIVAKK